MIDINVQTEFGFLVGFSLADRDECEEFEIQWGITIALGIFTISVCKHCGPGDRRRRPHAHL
jgi:hypothetical protein